MNTPRCRSRASVLPMTWRDTTPHRFAAAMAFTASARIWERWTISPLFLRLIPISRRHSVPGAGQSGQPVCGQRRAFPTAFRRLAPLPRKLTCQRRRSCRVLPRRARWGTRFCGGGTACGANFQRQREWFDQLAVPLHWVVGTTQQWNFTIQRELGRDWFAELGYVGTKGSRLRSTYDPDQGNVATPQNPVVVPGQGCANLQAAGSVVHDRGYDR